MIDKQSLSRLTDDEIRHIKKNANKWDGGRRWGIKKGNRILK